MSDAKTTPVPLESAELLVLHALLRAAIWRVHTKKHPELDTLERKLRLAYKILQAEAKE